MSGIKKYQFHSSPFTNMFANDEGDILELDYEDDLLDEFSVRIS